MRSSVVSRFGDPYAFQAAVRAADVEVVVTGRGAFAAELTHIVLDRLWTQQGRESLPRVAHTAIGQDRRPIFFLAGSDEPPIRHGGRELSAGEIAVYSPEGANYQRSSAPCHWAAMSLTPEDLASAGHGLAGRELHAPRSTSIIRPGPAALARLRRLHNIGAGLARKAPALLAHPETARALENALVHAMIACLAEHEPVADSLGSRSHSAVMARFGRALEAEPKRPLYLAEICAATGVAERTLRLCCREHLGMGPVRFLWLRRMHLARHALVASDPAATSVTEIAVDHGFWELGRFAVAYRSLFGESPSASLRRAADLSRTSLAAPFALEAAPA
jgi:AraC-like DNA-binding protein